ncbi:(2Fe-2S)-binding protein [Thermodesulfobacteriota bacterium]
MKLRINNQVLSLDVDLDTPLLWVLRDHLGLTGTKFSCGIGVCGACTVHVGGKATRSCTLTIGEVGNREVVTIEGLDSLVGKLLKRLWIEEDVPQCGYCQPGQIMTAAGFILNNPQPTKQDLEDVMSGVLCRCGTYQDIRRALRRSLEEL